MLPPTHDPTSRPPLQANGGSWEAPRLQQPLESAQLQLPSWVWTGLHHFAPDPTQAAAMALDVFTAAEYFPPPPLAAVEAGRAADGQQQPQKKLGPMQQPELMLRLALASAASLAVTKVESLLAALPAAVAAAAAGGGAAGGAPECGV